MPFTSCWLRSAASLAILHRALAISAHLLISFAVLLVTGCSCSSDDGETPHASGGAGHDAGGGAGGTDTPSKPDDWVPPEGITACDEGRDRRCLHADADGDGVSVAEGDCDDSDVNAPTDCTKVPVVPPPRTCNGADCSAADQDGDGLTPAQGDCDDTDPRTYPGAPDPCGDGIDNDCDGFDVACDMADNDGDGITPAQGDCDDTDPSVNGAAREICGDGIDNDCRGGDLSCDDADQDGDGATASDGDCDDGDPSIGPDAVELCGDGIDNDCDGATDDTCTVGPETPIRVTLGTDEPLTLRVVAKLPDPQAGDVGADVMFLVDQSASFDDDIYTFKNSASSIISRLSEAFGDLRVGLASFRDAPCAVFGGALEWAYKLNLPLTDDLAAFAGIMDTLATAPGNTSPEAALEGIGQVLTGRGHSVNGFGECDIIADIAPSNPGWQRGRIPLLIVSTDAPFNRPGDDQYPYPTGVAEVIQLALDSGTRIFFMISGNRDPEDQLIADATGGQVFELAGDSTGIVLALGSALDSSLSDVEVRLVPQGVGAELIESVEPELVPGVNLLVDDAVEFQLTFERTLTRKTADQVFEFDLVLETRGIESTRIPVIVTIPGIDV